MGKVKADNKLETAEKLPSKMKMVKEALESIGHHATPAQIQPWILERYQTEIDKQMISSYASQARRKMFGVVKPPMSGEESRGGGLGARELAVLQSMLRKVGPTELQNYIKLLSR
jgi:hypothetical protein